VNFASWEYGFLLVATLILFWSLPSRWRIHTLLVSSYYFYMSWDARFVALLLTSTTTYYLCGLGIAKREKSLWQVAGFSLLPGIWLSLCAIFHIQEKLIDNSTLLTAYCLPPVMVIAHQWIGRPRSAEDRQKAFLGLALIINLALLGFFKYFNFFADSTTALLDRCGLHTEWFFPQVILPVGISFYTFQAISYVVDIRNGKIKPTDCFVTFATYLAFFPQLVAGPIERSAKLLPQFLNPAKWDPTHLQVGLRLLLIGFFKKLFVADNCAIIANHVFSGEAGELNTAWALLGVLAFAFQIYGDFSGYSDIARGSARLLGIELTLNFKSPFNALNPSDFWRRWHITLSTWFRDYVYIPLGGNRSSKWKISRNLAIAMILAGLWHGAAWTFILWGAYHAFILIVFHHSHKWQRLSESGRSGKLISWALMSVLTLLGWAIFRAESMAQLNIWWTSIFQWQVEGALDWQKPTQWLALHIVPLLLLQWATRNKCDESSLDQVHWIGRGFIYMFLLLLTASSMVNDKDFIYFQF
jgi:alginate O-acetyltransferase complex protein AlgI